VFDANSFAVVYMNSSAGQVGAAVAGEITGEKIALLCHGLSLDGKALKPAVVTRSGKGTLLSKPGFPGKGPGLAAQGDAF